MSIVIHIHNLDRMKSGIRDTKGCVGWSYHENTVTLHGAPYGLRRSENWRYFPKKLVFFTLSVDVFLIIVVFLICHLSFWCYIFVAFCLHFLVVLFDLWCRYLLFPS